MNYFLNTHHFLPISCLHSKLQYIFFRKLWERYFIVKKDKKILWLLQCMEFYKFTQLTQMGNCKHSRGEVAQRTNRGSRANEKITDGELSCKMLKVAIPRK